MSDSATASPTDPYSDDMSESKAPDDTPIPELLGFGGAALAQADSLEQLLAPSATKPPSIRRYLAVMALVVLMIGLAITLISALIRGTPSQLTPGSPPRNTHTVELIEARDGVVLLLEHSDQITHILLQRAGQPNPSVVSGNETTAFGPSLSPDASWVAYFSKQADVQLTVAPVITGSKQTISAKSIAPLANYRNIQELTFCSWTSIKWNPAGDKVAFFGCDPNEVFSVGLLGILMNTGLSVEPLKGSEADVPGIRQLLWLDDTQIVITLPISGTATGTTFSILNVP